jgi:hypothetical protein
VPNKPSNMPGRWGKAAGRVCASPATTADTSPPRDPKGTVP